MSIFKHFGFNEQLNVHALYNLGPWSALENMQQMQFSGIKILQLVNESKVHAANSELQYSFSSCLGK